MPCEEVARAPVEAFRSFRFFELPPYADTGNGSVERPCFLSDHIRLVPVTNSGSGDKIGDIVTILNSSEETPVMWQLLQLSIVMWQLLQLSI